MKLVLDPDETEFIAICPFPFREVQQMVRSGEIVDSMTIIAVLSVSNTRGF